jgi:hypothetical protein
MIKKIVQNKFLLIMHRSNKIIIKSTIKKWYVWTCYKPEMYNLLLISFISAISVYLMLWKRKTISDKIYIYLRQLIIKSNYNFLLIFLKLWQKLKLDLNLQKNKNKLLWTNTIQLHLITKIKVIFLLHLIFTKELLS